MNIWHDKYSKTLIIKLVASYIAIHYTIFHSLSYNVENI